MYIISLFFSTFILGIFFVNRYGFLSGPFIFQDDFFETYIMSLKGVEMLFKGGLFGWDWRHLGGYPVAYTGATMITFVYLPFYFLGEYGYKVMFLFLCAAFPFLVSRYAKVVFKDKKTAIYAVFLSLPMFFLYVPFFLEWGNLHDLAGIDVFITCLIFYERMKRGRRWSFLFLSFFFVLLCYTYVIYWFFFLAFMIIDVLVRRDKPLFIKVLFLSLIAFLGTLNYFWYFIKFGDYYRYSLTDFSSGFNPGKSVAAGLSGLAHYLLGVKILPFTALFIVSLVLQLRDKKCGKSLLYFLLILLASAFLYDSDFILLDRVIFIVPVFSSVVLSYYSAKFRKAALFLFVPVFLLLFLAGDTAMFKEISCISDLNEWNRPLCEKIKGLEGNMVLFENVKGLNILNYKNEKTWKMVKHTHIAQALAIKTNKRLFSGTHDGWHESCFRGSAIMGGIYKGEYLFKTGIEEIEKELNKWGIKYLVLHTRLSKIYFSRHSDIFKKIWGEGDFVILEYLKADPGEIVMPSGYGRITHEDYFDRKVMLYGAKTGEEIIIRANYFPLWKGYSGNMEVGLYDKAGQVAFKAPADGDYLVTLKFSKLSSLALLIPVSFFIAFLIALFRKT